GRSSGHPRQLAREEVGPPHRRMRPFQTTSQPNWGQSRPPVAAVLTGKRCRTKRPINGTRSRSRTWRWPLVPHLTVGYGQLRISHRCSCDEGGERRESFLAFETGCTQVC